MSRPATARLKCNPPLGRMPVLQFMTPGELAIDPTYQRSILGGDSQALIRRIAQHWNWDLCQPLVVARRAGGELFVIDGQHRLEAARARGDIAMLPCVVVDYASAADEAASFVHLNQQRRPLNRLDLFKAALASEDPQALAISEAMEAAGLSLAPHMTSISWKPGQVGNIGGVEQAWRRHGAVATREALQALAAAFAGEVLQYAGTIFPGIVAVCAEECRGRSEFPASSFATFTAKLGAKGQKRLRKEITALHAERADLGRTGSAVKVITELHWPERVKIAAQVETAMVAARAPVDQARFARKASDEASAPLTAWCEQCEMRVTQGQAEQCRSRWCSLRKSA